ELDFYGSHIRSLTDQIAEIELLENELKNQVEIAQEDFEIAKRRYSVDSSLFAQEVMTTMEFDQSRSRFLAVKKNLVGSRQNIANNSLTVLELQARIRELKLQKGKQNFDL